jgi:tRNA A37 methylthiotransferase MiaB
LLDQGRAPAHLDFDRHHCRISRRNPDDFIQTMDLLAEVEYDCVFGFKYSGRPNTPALTMIDSIPEVEKAARLQVVLDRQREIQRVNYARHLGQIMEVMVEGVNPARGQVIGRSSQNKPVNFTCAQPIAPAPGSYLQVKITATHPNSGLVTAGEGQSKIEAEEQTRKGQLRPRERKGSHGY